MWYILAFISGIAAAYAAAYAKEELRVMKIHRRARQEAAALQRLRRDGWIVTRDLSGWDSVQT